MRLEVVRRLFTDVSTVGSFLVDGVKVCDTLEDCDRLLESDGCAAKVYGKTAIPRGEYQVRITWSNRWSKYMMQLIGVPCFEGIRIHAGNAHTDTDGCILLGNAVDEWTLVNSRANTQKVFDVVEAAIKKGEEVLIVVR